MNDLYYPENESFLRGELDVANHAFAQAREAVLLDHRFATAAAYWGDLDDLRAWCLAEGIDILNPAAADLQRYLGHMHEMNYSPNTIARRLTTFRAFYRHLTQTGQLHQSPMAEVSHPARPPADQATSPAATEELAVAARISGHRDTALVRLLCAGLKTAQICRARVEDLTREPNRTVLHVQTRSTAQAIELDTPTTAALDTYLAGRTHGPLLLDRNSQPLDRFDVRRAIQRIRRRAATIANAPPPRIAPAFTDARRTDTSVPKPWGPANLHKPPSPTC